MTSPSIAVCEWQSTIPGVTCLPAASITIAPAGGSIVPPTLETLPPTTSRSPRSIVPAGPMVQIVAPRTRIADEVAWPFRRSSFELPWLEREAACAGCPIHISPFTPGRLEERQTASAIARLRRIARLPRKAASPDRIVNAESDRNVPSPALLETPSEPAASRPHE